MVYHENVHGEGICENQPLEELSTFVFPIVDPDAIIQIKYILP